MYNYIRNLANKAANEIPFEIGQEARTLTTPAVVAGGGLLASYLANGLLPGSDVDPATIALGAGAAFGTPTGSLYSKVGKLALGGEIAKTALNDALGTNYQTPGIVPVGLLAGGLANRYGKRWFDGSTRNTTTPNVPSTEDIAYGTPEPTTQNPVVKVTPDAWDMEVNRVASSTESTTFTSDLPSGNSPKNSAPPIVSQELLGGSKVVNPNPSAVVQDVIDTKSTASSPLGIHYGLTPEQEQNLMTNIGNARWLDPAKLKAVLDPERTAFDGRAFVDFFSQELSPELAASMVFPSQLQKEGQVFYGKKLYNPDNYPVHKDYQLTDRTRDAKVIGITKASPNTTKDSYLVQTKQMKEGGLYPGVQALEIADLGNNLPPHFTYHPEKLGKLLNELTASHSPVNKNIVSNPQQVQDILEALVPTASYQVLRRSKSDDPREKRTFISQGDPDAYYDSPFQVASYNISKDNPRIGTNLYDKYSGERRLGGKTPTWRWDSAQKDAKTMRRKMLYKKRERDPNLFYTSGKYENEFEVNRY